jgi:hypothetical protein
MELYSKLVPESLDTITPEERNRLYQMLWRCTRTAAKRWVAVSKFALRELCPNIWPGKTRPLRLRCEGSLAAR